MPWRDWQFWVVTLLMLAGLWIVARTVIPMRRRARSAADSDPSCPNCASGSAAANTRHRVVLTIERRKP